jgi:hypothetical protein
VSFDRTGEWYLLYNTQPTTKKLDHVYLKFLKFKLDRHYEILFEDIEIDSSDDTRPVSFDVSTQDQINDNINPIITYGKVK